LSNYIKDACIQYIYQLALSLSRSLEEPPTLHARYQPARACKPCAFALAHFDRKKTLPRGVPFLSFFGLKRQEKEEKRKREKGRKKGKAFKLKHIKKQTTPRGCFFF